MPRDALVIGVTGSFGSGVTSIAGFLESELDFRRFSLSEIVSKQADSQGYAVETLGKEHRHVLQDVGDQLRKGDLESVVSPVVRAILEHDGSVGGYVVDGVRNPAEVKALRREFSNFYLVALGASADVRFTRKRRECDGDRNVFDRDDKRDSGEYAVESYEQNTSDCVLNADVFINNDRQLVERWEFDRWLRSVNQYVTLMRGPGRAGRPTYDELHMQYAYSTSLKSPCLKRKVGAVIVALRAAAEPQITPLIEERTPAGHYVIATGRNEAPPGITDCSERRYCEKDSQIWQMVREMKYCPGCGNPLDPASIGDSPKPYYPCVCGTRLGRDFIPGRSLDICIAVHAEESAILQAAHLGTTSLNGTRLYSTTFPCLLCAKMIAAVGIAEVVYLEPYPSPDARKLLEDARVNVRRFEGVLGRAFHRLYERY